MRRIQINHCTIAYEFDELDGFLTYCYLIDKSQTYYVIDTFCGSIAMALVAEDMVDSTKNVVVVNTHFHWDHIWGNGYFEGADIVAHSKCAALIETTFEEGLEANEKYRMGNVKKTAPNITFERQYILEEGLTLFYSPGHTVDSCSLYDSKTGLLIVGDNLELPLVYIADNDLVSYIKSLKQYKHLCATYITSGHTLKIEPEAIEEFIDYLYNVDEGNEISFEDESKQKVHQTNLKTLLELDKS